MESEPTTAVIKSKFDLGYLVVLENGEKAQLRAPEQRGATLRHHLAGEEEALYGKRIPVFVVFRDERVCAVSQFSPDERLLRKHKSATE